MRTQTSKLAASIFALALVLTGCTTAGAPVDDGASESTGGLETRYGLEGLDARAVIEKLDTTDVNDRPEGLQASIRPSELILVDDSGEERLLPTPEDEVYIAIAPYVTQTHDCTFHAPNSCLGEMREVAVSVTITDAASGRVYVEESAVTYDNGFIGYWLPRGIDATVTMTVAGKSGNVDITTHGAAAPTCITTLKVA